MPKLKTHSGAKKRIKKLKSGKFKASKIGHRHLLGKKTAKTKRNQRRGLFIAPADSKHVAALLP